MTTRCKKHPRYGVKRQPRSTCEACWALWVLTHWFHAMPPKRRSYNSDDMFRCDSRGDVPPPRSNIPYDDGRG